MASPKSMHICHIVPPYLLKGIAESPALEESHKEVAQRSLAHREEINSRRERRFAALTAPRGQAHYQAAHQSIVPDFLLKSVVDSDSVDQVTKDRAQRDLESIQKVHASYQKSQGLASLHKNGAAHQVSKKPTTDAGFWRGVYDAKQDEDENNLPGTVVRIEGQPAVKDQPANEAYDNAGKVLEFYEKFFNWKSIDNKNMHVISSVHFAKDYENAFWDPEKMQMVYGDGHDFLYHFTKAVDVIGHELTHAVTEHTAPLDYTGQSGALNEHVSDVFGIMVKQWVENETADKADWLIGEGVLLPDVKGIALRSMKAPGTAYNDPRFGKDPQPANMSGYHLTVEDNGGVHLFSGIPNRAFYLASVGFGGYSWEKAGQIWWKTMNSGRVPARCTFLQFADVTVEIAEEAYGDEGAKIVRNAWNTVGVVRKGH